MKKILSLFLSIITLTGCLNNPFTASFYKADSGNPNELTVSMTYRDFKQDGLCFEGGISGLCPGITDNQLVNGKPVFNTVSPLPYSTCYINGDEDLGTWYADDHPMKISDVMTFLKQPDGSFKFGTDEFFPIDGRGYFSPDLPDPEITYLGHNYFFTTEMKINFKYNGNEFIDIWGDDDIWVFVNNKLVIDLGGTHPQSHGSSYLNAEVSGTLGLNLIKGKKYQLALFHAERHTAQSTFNFTLQNFNVVN